MNVLVIAPHPDDEAIGCGGTVRLHALREDRIAAVFLTSGELGLPGMPAKKASHLRESEARKSARILGINDLTFLRNPDGILASHSAKAAAQIRIVLKHESPDIIYLPHAAEWHPDHQAVAPILKSALADTSLEPELRCYEIWTPLMHYGHVENISEVMAEKIAAVRCHKSQVSQWAYDRAIAGLNRYRGVMAARACYAEVFQLLGPSI